MPAGSGAPTNDGDYISANAGLNTSYHYFIEVVPGIGRLRVQIFDADYGRGGGGEAAAQRDRARGGFNSTVTYTLFRPDGSTAATLNCSGTRPAPTTPGRRS